MDRKAEIKERLDLIDIVEELTGQPTKRVGNWTDLEECPFCHGHDCFRIPSHGRFGICYQCGPKHYDVFQFWMDYKHVKFNQALKDLSIKAGLPAPKKRAIQIARAAEIFEMAGEMFKNALLYGNIKIQYKDGELVKEVHALEYIKNVRKRSEETIEKWKIGITYDGYVDDLKLAGFSEEEIESCQLMYRGAQSFGAGLVSFPCHLPDGSVSHIRFKDPSKSKREAQIRKTKWNKKFAVFNQQALDNKRVVVVEGENDTISAEEAGAPTIGLLSGPTKDLVKWLQKEYGDRRFFLAFDNDEAGRNYVRRFIALWRGAPVMIMGWESKDVKDIDELLTKSSNPEKAIEKLFEKAVHPREEYHTTGAIFENEVGYHIYRGENLAQLTNFKIDIKGIEIDPETKVQEWIADIYSDTESVRNIPLPAESFASSRDFKKLVGSYGTFLYLGTDRELQELVGMVRLKHKDVPKITLMRQIGYVEHIDSWFAGDLLVQPDGQIKKGSEGIVFVSEKHGLILVPPSNAPRYSQEIYAVTSADEVKQVTSKFLSVLHKNVKRGSLLAFGWTMASMFAEQFSRRENWFPILWLGGEPQAGKNVLAEVIRTCLGLPSKPETMSESFGGITEVALMRNLEFFSNLPVWVDEVTNKALETKFTSIFKDIYMRAVASKGMRKAHRLRLDVVRGTLMVTAEEFPQDPGLRSRCLPIMLAQKFRDDKYWPDVQAVRKKLPIIGSHVVLNYKDYFIKFMEYYDKWNESYYTDKSDLRIQKSVCLALAGLQLLAPKEIVREGVKQAEWLLEHESHPVVAADRKQGDNFFRWVMQAAHDGDVDKSVLRIDNKGVVRLHLQKAYNDMYDKKMSFRREFPNPRKLMLILEAQPYFLRKEAQWTDTVHKPYVWCFKPEGPLAAYQDTTSYASNEVPSEDEIPDDDNEETPF